MQEGSPIPERQEGPPPLSEEALLHTSEPPPQHQASEAGSARLRIVELNDSERQLASTAAEERMRGIVNAGHVEPGSTDFFDAAEVLEGAFPEPARAALASLRRGSVDAVVLRGLPSDAEPGATPAPEDPGTPPLLGYTWLSMAVRRLGHELGYALEKDGRLVHDVCPTAEGATSQSNASWQVDLSLHTENAFHPVRPDYVLLYCVRAPSDGPPTSVVPLDDVIVHLTDSELAVLREPRFTISVVDSHRMGGEADLAMPAQVLGGSHRRPTVRWHETLRAADEGAAKAAQAFAGAANRATRRIQLQPGDLLAFSNDRCLHGRGKFDARLDGQDRWLLRAYVLRDLTRALSFVAPARPRVMRMDLAAQAGA